MQDQNDRIADMSQQFIRDLAHMPACTCSLSGVQKIVDEMQEFHNQSIIKLNEEVSKLKETYRREFINESNTNFESNLNNPKTTNKKAEHCKCEKNVYSCKDSHCSCVSRGVPCNNKCNCQKFKLRCLNNDPNALMQKESEKIKSPFDRKTRSTRKKDLENNATQKETSTNVTHTEMKKKVPNRVDLDISAEKGTAITMKEVVKRKRGRPRKTSKNQESNNLDFLSLLEKRTRHY